MVSESKRVQSIVEIFAKKGIKNIVFSPGSRNAPLVISFTNDKRFECISIVDERSAAFYALGLSIAISQPVAICCTSGSASLNYSSALSEAYYQGVPLIAVTTDRPPEWINHGEGQAINQTEVYEKFTHSGFNLPIGEEKEDIWYTQRQINEAINNSIEHQLPVHINFPFREPLYITSDTTEVIPQIIHKVKTKVSLEIDDIKNFSNQINNSPKVLIICGQNKPNKHLNHILEEIAQLQNICVMTESTSNLYSRAFIPCIDRVITSIKEVKDFEPNILISIGGAIISKKIKQLLRNTRNLKHWSINPNNKATDTYQSLSYIIPVTPNYFFRTLKPFLNFENESNYKNKWTEKNIITKSNHDNHLPNIKWSDLKAFDIIYNTLPENCNLHLGNSSPVRYMQLFNQIQGITYYSNRGVSGIDGSTSTMFGVAAKNKCLNILISGDLSFIYDTNSFWNNHLTNNTRVIVINNSGGGIFRIIPGPSESGALEDFFEVGNNTNIQKIAQTHDINYYKASNEIELEDKISIFYNSQENNRPAILEIFTPNKINPLVLKEYFTALGK